MPVEILVATMHQQDFSKINEMNIRTDVIFANQADSVSYAEKDFAYGRAKMITSNTRGVGKNRNIALTFAEGDILLFSDDDVQYRDDAAETVERAFAEIPDADAVVFNVDSNNPNEHRRMNTAVKRLHWHDCMAYGAVRLAVKRSSIKRENISFNENFGGGTAFSSGEDSLFIADMLKKKLKLYAYPETIAVVDDLSDSSWFTGYNEKYYYDKGVFFKTLSKNFGGLLCLQDLLRHQNYKEGRLSFSRAWRLMKMGMKQQATLTPISE